MIDEIYLKNFEVFSKLVLYFGLMAYSSIYLFIIQKDQKKTSFFTVGIARMLSFWFSWVLLITSPLSLLLLSPELPASQFYYIIIYPYIIVLTLLIFIASFESFYYIPSLILRIGGLDVGHPRIRKGVNELRRFIGKR